MNSSWGKNISIVFAWVSFLSSLVLAVRVMLDYIFNGSATNAAVGLSGWIFLIAILAGSISVALQIIIHSPNIKKVVFVLALIGIILSIIAGVPLYLECVTLNFPAIG